MNTSELMDKEQLAAYLNVRIETVAYLLYHKQIPCVRIGREYRFPKADIDRWVQHKLKKSLQQFSQNYIPLYK